MNGNTAQDTGGDTQRTARCGLRVGCRVICSLLYHLREHRAGWHVNWNTGISVIPKTSSLTWLHIRKIKSVPLCIELLFVFEELIIRWINARLLIWLKSNRLIVSRYYHHYITRNTSTARHRPPSKIRQADMSCANNNSLCIIVLTIT